MIEWRGGKEKKWERRAAMEREGRGEMGRKDRKGRERKKEGKGNPVKMPKTILPNFQLWDPWYTLPCQISSKFHRDQYIMLSINTHYHAI